MRSLRRSRVQHEERGTGTQAGQQENASDTGVREGFLEEGPHNQDPRTNRGWGTGGEKENEGRGKVFQAEDLWVRGSRRGLLGSLWGYHDFSVAGNS